MCISTKDTQWVLQLALSYKLTVMSLHPHGFQNVICSALLAYLELLMCLLHLNSYILYNDVYLQLRGSFSSSEAKVLNFYHSEHLSTKSQGTHLRLMRWGFIYWFLWTVFQPSACSRAQCLSSSHDDHSHAVQSSSTENDAAIATLSAVATEE